MNKVVLGLLLVVSTAYVTACGVAGSASDTSAIHQWLKDASPQISTINKQFTQESNLVKEVSVRTISYASFKKSYDLDEILLKESIKKLQNVSAQAGAKPYKTDYLSLMNVAAKLMSQQEQAIQADGTIDTQRAQTIKTQFNSFEASFQALSSKYGLH